MTTSENTQGTADLCPEYPYQPICFNQGRFREDLAVGPALQVFKSTILGVNQHFELRFREGEEIRDLVAERAAFVDLLLYYAWNQFDWGEDIALVAVGGYGRSELLPHSDIDILVLLGNKVGSKYNQGLQDLVAFLWDIGLKVGSSVRTLKEAVKFAKEDVTVATNLIESRTIIGNSKLLVELRQLTRPKKSWSHSKFFKAKWEEQQERHKKHNDTGNDLEPNVKNSPGGLRDTQTVNWVAKYYFGVFTIRQLEGKDFFTEEEFGVLRSGEAFLWRIRFGIHMLSGRPEERLLFEYQRELAKMFGYVDTDKCLAVERLMYEYYRVVQAIRELNDVLLHFLDELIHNKHKRGRLRQLDDKFQLRDGYIEVVSDKTFDEHPEALLEIFVVMGNNPDILGLRASTIRLIRDRRWLIDDDFRQNTKNRQTFMKVFDIEYGLVTQLTRMKRYGILGRYLPAFGKIIGQMQHDLFHRYTVDAHSLLVIQNMRRFTQPEEEQLFPVAAHVMNHLQKPALLYIAGLFHDIGKGRGGDHSVLGAVDAYQFCVDHGLRIHECRLVKWLVEKHLLMSYVSQKQDISEPGVIHGFARQVGDQMHLDYLYALTVADMCGTNPDIWNPWRASLLRQLYTETKAALRRGFEDTVDKQGIIDEKQHLSLLKLSGRSITREQAIALWKNMGDEYFVRESHVDIAWQTSALAKHQSDEPLVLIRKSAKTSRQGATQIFIRVKNAQHVFIAVATCLARLSLNILDASVYSSADDYTLDTFYVLDENFEPLDDQPENFARIEQSLKEELKLVGEYSELVQRRTPRQLKQFPIPTRTRISNDIVTGRTVLEVISPDRPGLLATIAHIFMELGVLMQSAKISTLGERVEDVFFITNIDNSPLSDAKACEDLQTEICRQLDFQVKQEQNQ
ncbi:MAG: [protein-PII] uridylyltransferase [Alteromonadaceae bacterium]|nr:MAG: [protein-PII] uridylyltransferase [Alteromonadaceae bacterium]